MVRARSASFNFPSSRFSLTVSSAANAVPPFSFAARLASIPRSASVSARDAKHRRSAWLVEIPATSDSRDAAATVLPNRISAPTSARSAPKPSRARSPVPSFLPVMLQPEMASPSMMSEPMSGVSSTARRSPSSPQSVALSTAATSFDSSAPRSPATTSMYSLAAATMLRLKFQVPSDGCPPIRMNDAIECTPPTAWPMMISA